MHALSRKSKKRFWGHVAVSVGCWEWRGRHTSNGYGRFKIQGLDFRAHRLSYELACGPIPNGLSVLHSCDNKLCVRPEHLRTGTQRENLQDMVDRGRSMVGKRNPKARLSEEAVILIRLCSQQGWRTKFLAGIFQVSMGHVNKIIRRERWGHVA